MRSPPERTVRYGRAASGPAFGTRRFALLFRTANENAPRNPPCYDCPMSEFGGFESYTPSEGQAAGLEGLSEEAKQRFAAAAKAMQQLRREERQAKKKDDQVARTIIQFLQDPAHTRFFILISKLVGRNCPSIFILGLLSLIHDECLAMVREYFSEHEERDAPETVDESTALIHGRQLDQGTHHQLVDWITRLQMILAHDPERILHSLMLDEKRIDGSVLQLAIFVLEEFFQKEGRELPYEKAQPLTASILQTVFEPFMGAVKKEKIENEDQ